MRRWAAVAVLAVGAPSVVLACAQILDVEAGTLTVEDGSVGTSDGTTAEASGPGPEASGPETGADAHVDDAGPSRAPDGDADAAPIPACDPSASDAATGGFGAWYPVGSAIFPSGANVIGVTPVAGRVALFAVDTSGDVVSTQASAPFGAGAWSAWAPVTTTPTPFPPGAPISAVARGNGRVDLFAVRDDGAIVTLVNGSASGWATVGTGAPTFLAQRVAAVAPDPTDVHVLAVADGGVYETSASGDASAFSPWKTIGTSQGGALTSVGIVSPNPVTLDVFAPGDDGLIYMTSRTLAPSDTGWSSWAPLQNVTFPAGPLVTASSHFSMEFDVFALDFQGSVSTTLHNDLWPDGGWVRWQSLGGMAMSGSRIIAVSTMDLYLIDTTGEVVTLPFDQRSFRWATSWTTISTCSPVTATSIEAVRGVGTAIELIAVDTKGGVFIADRASSP